jgi:hypothetical protein
MNEVIKKGIEKYYKNKVTEDYLVKCKESIRIPLELNLFVKENDIEIIDTNDGEIWPSSKLIFEYEKYTKGEFEIIYSSTLLISKLAPLIYLQHEFEVENKDSDSISSTLDGFDTQPYTRKQQELDELIKNKFTESGYTVLSYRELNEIIPDLSFNPKVTFFGTQVTVEHALFFDLLDFCPE